MIVSAGRALDLVRFGAPPHQFLKLIAAIVTAVFKDRHGPVLFYQPGGH
jgi:hypothetical protein